jgi:hypothetical protein
LPAVILIHGCGDVGGNVDAWDKAINVRGVPGFSLDAFSDRGIARPVVTRFAGDDD